jgi:hypothetical protein
MYKGLGNSMPRSYTRQATRLSLVAPGSHRVGRGNYPITFESLYVTSELVCSRLETPSLDCFWITVKP